MRFKILLVFINALFSLIVSAQDFDWYDKPGNWQFSSDNYWVCAVLNNGSAKTRYADGTPVAENSSYDVTSNMNSDQCGYGWIRLDHREILKVYDQSGDLVQQLVWHKGGQDYSSPQPPYGWVDINDINIFDGALEVPTAQNVPIRNGNQPDTKGMAPPGMPLVSEQPLENGVPYWNSSEDLWDTRFMLGKGCAAEENILYHYKMVPTSHPDGIPESWQYKQFTTSSKYNKYADGGANYGDGTAEYAWLVWNFLVKGDGETNLGGGGQMRGLIKNGQEFYRCEVKSIKAKAWEKNGDAQVGEITAWYVKTRGNPWSEWMYGWMIAEHRQKNPDGSFGQPILHYQVASVVFAANAGPDRTVYTHADSAILTLVGDASTGSITDYAWSINGYVIATGSNTDLKLPLGSHEIKLTLTDTADATSEDVIIISVAAAPDKFRYEAENAAYISASAKSGGTGEYIDLQSDGKISWDIRVFDSGNYKLVFNVAVPSESSRSMGVFLNGSKIGTLNSSSIAFSDKSITALLERGINLIELMDSEGSSELNVDYLDLIYLGTEKPQGNALKLQEFVSLYPNPLKAGQPLIIELYDHSCSDYVIEIFNMSGKKVYQHYSYDNEYRLRLDDLYLEESFYILGIRSGLGNYFLKLICSG